MASYERSLIEFVTKCILDSSEISDFSTTTLGVPRFVQVGINDEEPPSFEGQSVIVILGATPLIPEFGADRIRTDLMISVGHIDGSIDDFVSGAETAKQHTGLLNNADFAQLVGGVVCTNLQKSKVGASTLNVVNLMENFYPNFVHMLQISISTPKQYRDSVYVQQFLS